MRKDTPSAQHQPSSSYLPSTPLSNENEEDTPSDSNKKKPSPATRVMQGRSVGAKSVLDQMQVSDNLSKSARKLEVLFKDNAKLKRLSEDFVTAQTERKTSSDRESSESSLRWQGWTHLCEMSTY